MGLTHAALVAVGYKLIHFDSAKLDEWELFDLEPDPRESRSVYSEPAYQLIVRELKHELTHSLTHMRAERKNLNNSPRRPTVTNATGSGGQTIPLASRIANR